MSLQRISSNKFRNFSKPSMSLRLRFLETVHGCDGEVVVAVVSCGSGSISIGDMRSSMCIKRGP